MQTPLSGILNLEIKKAQNIEDKIVDIPVTVAVVHHQEYGSYLIDAGLDSSYTQNQYGKMKGILVKRFLGKGKQESNTDITSILKNGNIQIKSVFLTHLHFDHTAGIVDLPKNIPYVVGKGEIYPNFRFFMQSDHLAGLEYLYELDFSEGIDLPPFGKSIDLFGDGSLWAISSSGHSKGHVMYFINGVDEKVLVTGDACNNQYQFDIEIGPGYFSSDVDQAQKVLDSIKIFKERYPEIQLVFGHDI
jgi:glyoxylase-like metal-dependent hydrolase (beta-lactamase superfamily II)